MLRPGPEFFLRPAIEVAPDLLGAVVAHAGVSVRLTEVEAYAGTDDPGSHAFRGRTPRTEVMFGPAGRLYVYFVYGMHFCANVVCGPPGVAAAVLLRGGEVVDGVGAARLRRPAARSDRDLARGPGRMAQALALGRAENGIDTCAPESPVTVQVRAEQWDHARLASGPRVGVGGAGGDASAYPWRFWLTDEPTVSTYRPAVKRRPSGTAR